MSFLWGPDHDGHLFWECPYPPFVHIRESVEFRGLLLCDKSSWLGVFFGMVGYLLLLVLVGLLLGPPLVKTLLVLRWRGC